MLSKQEEFTKKVTDLPDTPSPNMTPAQIKEHFQTPAEELKEAHNKLVDELIAPTGALELGAKDADGTDSTVQDVLNARAKGLKQHQEATVLDHPDKSVTTAKLKDKAVTSEKIGDKEVKTNNLNDLSVTNEKIATGITGNKIADKQIGRNHIIGGAVGVNELDPAIVGQPKTDVGIQAKFQSLDEQLAHNAKELDKKVDVKSNYYSTETLVSFMFDDGFLTDYTRFKPIFESEGVPGNCCIVTDYLVNGRTGYEFLQPEHLKEFKQLGWTVASHTNMHPESRTKDDAYLDNDYSTAKQILKDLGMDHDILVYPFGSVDDRVRKIAKKYYEYGINIDQYRSNNPPNIDNMNLSRVSGLSQTGATLDSCKLDVDNAITNKEWIIFEDHSHYEFYDDPANLELLRQLIQYIKSKGVKIVSIRDGLESRANVIDVAGESDDNHFKLNRNGLITHPSVLKMKFYSGHIPSKPLTDFERGMTSVNISGANATGYPEGKAGTLVTFRPLFDGSGSYAFQIYTVFSNGGQYKRAWNTATSSWMVWKKTDTLSEVSADNYYTTSSLISDFPTNRITITFLTSAGSLVGAPFTLSGILETYRLHSTDSRNYQIFRDPFRTYRRTHDGTAWRSWYSDSEMLRAIPSTESLPNAIAGRMVYKVVDGAEDEVWICVKQSSGVATWKKVAFA